MLVFPMEIQKQRNVGARLQKQTLQKCVYQLVYFANSYHAELILALPSRAKSRTDTESERRAYSDGNGPESSPTCFAKNVGDD